MSTLYSSLDVNKPNNSHKFAHKKTSNKNIRNLKKKLREINVENIFKTLKTENLKKKKYTSNVKKIVA